MRPRSKFCSMAARWLAFRVAFAASTALSFVAPAGAVEAVPIGSFPNPVHVAVARGAPRLLFVVEQAGRIRLMRDETELEAPFLDIRDLVRARPEAGAGKEEGLLSVAFSPDYPTSRRFYVFFTNNDGDIEIDEFQRSATSALEADPASRRVVIVIPHQSSRNHNGGQVQFGPDGFLYISTGDGGASTLPRGERARRLGNLLGKILRIDPRQRGARQYRIPDDNPFRGVPGRNEIFAYGLRNPWRFTFDGARIAIGDVGAMTWEEANLLRIEAAKGANFGWPEYEADELQDPDRPGPHPPTFPIFAYNHADGGCAIIGGYVARDPDLPELLGRYVYGDVCTGEVRSFMPDVRRQEASADAPTGIVLPGVSSFGRGFGGKLYLTQRGLPGTVFRLVSSP